MLRGAPCDDSSTGAGWELPYETSHDEVIQGLSSIAVPLEVPGQRPAAIAVVYLTGPAEVAVIGERLAQAAAEIRADVR